MLTSRSGRGIHSRFASPRKKSGFFSPHMARRFYARFLYKQGYDLELIRQILGHEKLLRVVFDAQIEISETELRIWAERHPENGRTEIRSRVVGANPLRIKILDYDADHEQEVLKAKNRKKVEWKRKKAWERRFQF